MGVIAHIVLENMLVTSLIISLTLATLCQGQCQTPGNAICWLAAAGLDVGDPCCPGSACFPHPSDSPNSFCQYLDRIPEGGFCGDRVGICEDGTVCIADTCTKGTTTATTASTITATTCADLGETCFDPTLPAAVIECCDSADT